MRSRAGRLVAGSRTEGGAVSRVRRRSRASESDGLAPGLLEAAAGLRSGASAEEAWARAGIRLVDGVPEALDHDVDRSRVVVGPERRAVLAAARLSAHAGVAPAVVLERVAAGLALEAQARDAQRAAMAGPRASATVLAWLPVAGLVLGAALGADPWAVLLDGGGGSGLLAAGAALTWAGRRWTARHVAAARSAGRGG